MSLLPPKTFLPSAFSHRLSTALSIPAIFIVFFLSFSFYDFFLKFRL